MNLKLRYKRDTSHLMDSLRILRSETVERLLGNEGPSANPFLPLSLGCMYFIQEKVPCYALDEAIYEYSIFIWHP